MAVGKERRIEGGGLGSGVRMGLRGDVVGLGGLAGSAAGHFGSDGLGERRHVFAALDPPERPFRFEHADTDPAAHHLGVFEVGDPVEEPADN